MNCIEYNHTYTSSMIGKDVNIVTREERMHARAHCGLQYEPYEDPNIYSNIVPSNTVMINRKIRIS